MFGVNGADITFRAHGRGWVRVMRACSARHGSSVTKASLCPHSNGESLELAEVRSDG
jgi:hypothetical protein